MLGLRAGWDNALYEPTCTDIDVAGLHGFYLAAAKRAGATLLTDAALHSASRRHFASFDLNHSNRARLLLSLPINKITR